MGSFAGAFVTPPIQKRLSFGQAIIGSLWIFVLLWLLYAIALNIVLLAAITTIFFAGVTIYNNVQFSYRSALIPDTLQGRANSVFRLIAFSGPPLGMALTGLLLQGVSVLPTLLVFSACFVVLAIGATWNSHIRSAGKHNAR